MLKSHVSALLRSEQRLFHVQDLAALWQMQNLNTLHTTLSRYCRKGLLFRVYRGLYSKVPWQYLDALELGAKAIHGFNYLSCESVLVQHGLINAQPAVLSFVAEKPKVFSIGTYHYRCRQMSAAFLFNPLGVQKQGPIKIASATRALADMFYYNPMTHIDGKYNRQKVSEMMSAIGYAQPRYSV